MKNIFITIIVFIGISFHAFSIDKSSKEIKGDKCFFVYYFDKAIDHYSHTKQLTGEGQRRLAESYHHMGLQAKAEESYLKLLNMSGENITEDYYSLASILRNSGKYDEANKWMDKFAELKPKDLRSKDYKANKNKFSTISKDDGKFKIYDLDLNTDANDFGTCYYKDKIVFASTRAATPQIIVKKYNWTGKPFLDMYVSEVADGQLKSPKNFDKKLNGKLHDGPVSFSNNGTFMAFTKNNYKDKSDDKIVEIQLYFSSYIDNKWSTPVPFVLNDKGYSVGHPCLSSDGNTMYFASDMPGGYGGADIYKVIKNGNGEWGKAQNMGDKINTEGNELFPFLEEKHDILFFASDGHFGMGGLDIFIASNSGSSFVDVYNAGFPLNTQHDDFALIIDDKLTKGYFSSNRSGGKGGDDIYSVELLKPIKIEKKVHGIAKDKNGNPLPKTLVTLYNDKGIALDTHTTQNEGTYQFLAESDKKYKLVGKKEYYSDAENVINTHGEELMIRADLTLLSVKKAIPLKIEVGGDLGKIVELNSIYFDLDEYAIRPDAEVELKKIVTIINKHPNMVVELGSYTDCRETKAYNQLLSEKRAKASVSYIKKRITNPERIYGKGYGKTNLVNSCDCDGNVVSYCSEEEHQINRRTEFIIIKE